MRWTLVESSLGAAAAASVVALAPPCRADNPIVQTIYTADPAPFVHGDTVYLCTSHDEDVTVDNFFTMNDWFLFSSKDMVNWTDHGSPLSYQSFSWATGKAWAPHCATRDGKFYMYVPVAPNSIGVAVADSPTGPYSDPLGKPLVTGSYTYIDPTVFVDDDGQAYLFFGNPKLWYVRLNEDMISYSGDIMEIPQTTAAFGTRAGDAERPTLYEEGPWFYKRGDLYYMMYAASGIPEDIAYSTSPAPTGPWTYRGIIMTNQSGHAFTNHAGVVDFQDRSFFFYHTQELPGGGGFKRSVAVEEFTYNPDGSFPQIQKTSEGVVESVAPLIPYYRVEGETMAWGSGVEVEDSSEGGRNLSNLENGDYVKVEAVDFLTGALSFQASVASANAGGELELRVGGVDGTLIGTCSVPGTGGWQDWQLVSCDVSEVSGVHDLFLVFKGASGFLFNLDWWQFEPVDPLPPTGTGGMGPGGAPSSGGASGAGGSGGVPSGSGGTPPGSGGAPPGSGGAAPGAGGTPASGGAPANTGGAGLGGTPGSGGEIAGAGTPGTPAGESEGCACRAAPRSGTPPWSLVLLGGLVTARRLFGRRRRA